MFSEIVVSRKQPQQCDGLEWRAIIVTFGIFVIIVSVVIIISSSISVSEYYLIITINIIITTAMVNTVSLCIVLVVSHVILICVDNQFCSLVLSFVLRW